jgi:hypothetical protein
MHPTKRVRDDDEVENDRSKTRINVGEDVDEMKVDITTTNFNYSHRTATGDSISNSTTSREEIVANLPADHSSNSNSNALYRLQMLQQRDRLVLQQSMVAAAIAANEVRSRNMTLTSTPSSSSSMTLYSNSHNNNATKQIQKSVHNSILSSQTVASLRQNQPGSSDSTINHIPQRQSCQPGRHNNDEALINDLLIRYGTTTSSGDTSNVAASFIGDRRLGALQLQEHMMLLQQQQQQQLNRNVPSFGPQGIAGTFLHIVPVKTFRDTVPNLSNTLSNFVFLLSTPSLLPVFENKCNIHRH